MRLIPIEFRQDLSAFSVFDDPTSDDAALMIKRQDGAADWVLLVNQDAFFPEENFYPTQSVYALIHEFAHLLTLNQTQVDYYPVFQIHGAALVDDFTEQCATHLLQEGCLLSTSYLETFIDQFRTDEAFGQTEYTEDDWYSEKLYEVSPDQYVTDYAATNPAEDIAESFTLFVFNSGLTWTTIADQKIDFFSSYPELVRLRIHMRKRLRQLTWTDS